LIQTNAQNYTLCAKLMSTGLL